MSPKNITQLVAASLGGVIALWFLFNLFTVVGVGQVQEIRERLAHGESSNKIAPYYSVSPRTIRSIKSGDTWSGVR